MSLSTVYAKALFEAARDAKTSPDQMAKIESELDDFSRTVNGSREARILLFGPIANVKEKTGLVQQLTQKLGLSTLTSQFLSLLANKDRLRYIEEIQEAFSAVRVESEGGMMGTIVAADPVGPADVDGLASAFTKKVGKKVSFRVSTDPALLAGMKVTVGGTTYDGTLRSQLQQLRDRIVSGATQR